MIKNIWIETGYPNQNLIETLKIKPLKTIVETIINKTGIEEKFLLWIYKYVIDINNIYTTSILE